MVASDEEWPTAVAHFREMCAKYPHYAAARSLLTDAFRDARAALAAIRDLPEAFLDRLVLEAGVFVDEPSWQAAIDVALKE